MSGTLPMSPVRPREMTLRSTVARQSAAAHSRRRQHFVSHAQRFGLGLRWEFSRRADAAPLLAFLDAQGDEAASFEVPLAGFESPLGAWSGTPAVDGAAAAGYSLPVRGLSASVTGIAFAGDWLRIAGDNKLYLVTADADSDGAGKATLSIFPALQVTPADGALITVASPSMRCALTGPVREVPVEAPMRYGLALDLVEMP